MLERLKGRSEKDDRGAEMVDGITGFMDMSLEQTLERGEGRASSCACSPGVGRKSHT